MKKILILFSKNCWFNFPKSIKDFFYYYKDFNDSNKMLDFPASFRFEITNKCNADCIFCARQYDNSKKSIMDLDLFTNGLKQYFDSFIAAIAHRPPVFVFAAQVVFFMRPPIICAGYFCAAYFLPGALRGLCERLF